MASQPHTIMTTALKGVILKRLCKKQTTFSIKHNLNFNQHIGYLEHVVNLYVKLK